MTSSQRGWSASAAPLARELRGGISVGCAIDVLPACECRAEDGGVTNKAGPILSDGVSSPGMQPRITLAGLGQFELDESSVLGERLSVCSRNHFEAE
jgi:hypothetical protein